MILPIAVEVRFPVDKNCPSRPEHAHTDAHTYTQTYTQIYTCIYICYTYLDMDSCIYRSRIANVHNCFWFILDFFAVLHVSYVGSISQRGLYAYVVRVY